MLSRRWAVLPLRGDPPTRDGRISAIHNVANPDKLHAVTGGTTHDLGTR
ncbi:hypothetical protein [Streptomyces collinus]|nr:hypothetical protein [Streptomyces collinus]